MLQTAIKNDESITPEDPVWMEAGQAWGHAAVDWAFLFEPYARDAIEAIFSAASIGPRSEVLDVACGSGLALGRAARLGASTAGIDASVGLIDIARRRDPDGDIRVGDMFALPWEHGRFDLVTSFNGIWGGCEAAVEEMARVVKPGGMVAFTFWGRGKHLDLRDYFIAMGSSVPAVGEELMELANIGTPGVAEDMVEAAGLTMVSRGATTARMEWPDEQTAWRALRSPGVTFPALEALGERALRELALDSVASFRAPDGSYLLNNELTHIIARRPAH